MIQWSFPRYTWRGNPEGKTIYLTIDDGPTEELTPFIRETLQKCEIKATHFCVGENIQRNQKEAKQLITDGHVLANHTFNHYNGWKTEKEVYLNNVIACQDILLKNGIDNRLFRPPYGRITRKQADELINRNFKVVMWDVLSGDFDPNMTQEKCLHKSIQHTQPGSVIVFHDNLKCRKNMEFALPRYIEEMKSQGYRFDVL